jgi:hypothetical protein
MASHQIPDHVHALAMQIRIAKKRARKKCCNSVKEERYLVSRTTGSSPSTRPTRKCCCLKSGVKSAKAALSPPTRVERKDDWLLDEETDGLGDAGPDVGANGVPNGRFRAMKCS